LLKFAIFPSPLMRRCVFICELYTIQLIRLTTLLDFIRHRLVQVQVVSIPSWLLPYTFWCLAFYVLCIFKKFAVHLFHNKILMEIVLSWHLFDERQFAICCSSVFYSDDTVQEHLLQIVLDASSSEIHVLSKFRKLSQRKVNISIEVLDIEVFAPD
jgi:hypothetical protein